ncbi:ABC transporter permease [Dactylosporangium sp. NPDC051484]|uniref:ABC transporter permease n=1 Tax=Dactylosporangium sp. NPDC051484 TaxID=3154942 RepID=UPI00344F4A3C
MLNLIARRLAALIPTIFIVTAAVFALSLGIGMDKAAGVRAGDNPSVEAMIKAKEILGLDKPVTTRYVEWVERAVQLDFGRSFVSLEPVDAEGGGTTLRGISVREHIATVFPRTLSVTLIAALFALLIGIPVGIIGGVWPGTIVDRTSAIGAMIGLAVPSFWLAMLLVSWLAVGLGVLPAVGYETVADGGLWGWFKHLIIPGFALALGPSAMIARQMRAGLSDVMGSPYIRTAWAKGASLPRVIFRHALRNATSAPLTVFALAMTQLLGGVVIVESLFGIDGMGRLIVTSVRSNDVPMLQGVVMVFLLFTVTVNLLTDIAYGFLNPKVRPA